MKDNGQTALSRQTDVAIFALPIIVTSEEVCDASKAQLILNRLAQNMFSPNFIVKRLALARCFWG
jgi:hypothetical protein